MQPQTTEQTERKPSRRLLRDYELSAVIGIPVNTIRADRQNARRIPFVKLGRSIWYSLDSVLVAIERFQVGGAAPRKRNARGA